MCGGLATQVEMVEPQAADQLQIARDLDLVLHVDGAKIEFVGVVGFGGLLFAKVTGT